MKKNIYSQSIKAQDLNLYNNLVQDYLNDHKNLKPFHNGIIKNIKSEKKRIYAHAKQKEIKHREALKHYFEELYAQTELSPQQQQNIQALTDKNTFTVCSAHQPNIFLGYLYTIYKILQSIKTAETLSTKNFKIIPIFFMGSEDADFEELSTINILKHNYKWNTTQRGAFGRLSTKGLGLIINEIKYLVEDKPFGAQIIQLIQNAYNKKDIQNATFDLLNNLFKEYGLLILIPDNKNLKQHFRAFIKKDILNFESQTHIQQNITALKKLNYKIQANSLKTINFFYFINEKREKIEYENGHYSITNSELKFSRDEMEVEINNYPEKFSPNLFMRTLMQEYILPNLIFIGGSGEIAYWLELKQMFAHYKISFPFLKLRDSFVIIDDKNVINKIKKNKWTLTDIYKTDSEYIKEKLMPTKSHQQIDSRIFVVEKEIQKAYNTLSKHLATQYYKSLAPHILALQQKHTKDINKIRHKMGKLDKEKYKSILLQKQQIKNKFYPDGIFQERYDNFIYYYAVHGKIFFEIIKAHINDESTALRLILISK